jgi:glycosyltransferase involved in cell wall biosynthesis
MIKILHLNSSIDSGGAARIAKDLHLKLKSEPNIRSFFYYGRGDLTLINSKCISSKLDILSQLAINRITGIQGVGSFCSKNKLIQLIYKEKFDLIHLHNLHGYYLNIGFISALKNFNIPIVWTLHDAWPITGRFAYFSECNRWKTGCGSCPNMSWYPKTYFDSSRLMWKKKKKYFTNGWNPIIVCPSLWLADKVKESNAVDIEIFKRKDKIEIIKKIKIPLDKKVILFVSADLKDERKGVKYFFEALQYIKSNNWMVLTMGKKININREVKLNVGIKQLGYISDRNLISDIYNIADVFCITSLDENFPITVLEAMSCGIPVTGFQVGEIPEQVSSDCGILVPTKSTDLLAKNIDILFKSEKLRKEMSINCRKRIIEKYSSNIFVKKIYKTL